MPAASKAARSVGRPRDAAKRDAIVEAAWTLFLTGGVQASSLDAIARKARVSRVTLYSHFSDKASLFEETIEREMRRLATTQRPLAPEMPLREGLIAFGIGLLSFITSPTAASFYSVLAGELRRHPDLARRFFDAGPAVTHRNLALVLSTAVEMGQLVLDDPVEAADQLLGLWLGGCHYQLALGIDVDALVASVPRRVERGVDVFLRSHARP